MGLKKFLNSIPQKFMRIFGSDGWPLFRELRDFQKMTVPGANSQNWIEELGNLMESDKFGQLS